jgi:FixJ family two-component response regulator
MPRLGGIGLVKTLHEYGVRTPVLLMSGHTAREERTALQTGGIAAWLDKPPSSMDLARALAEALQYRRQ